MAKVYHTSGTPCTVVSDAVARRRADIFWARVDKSQDCWRWTGEASISGYGILHRHTYGEDSAHRYAYIQMKGPLPIWMDVVHKCAGGTNRLCVNPKHLVAVRAPRSALPLKVLNGGLV